MELQTGVLPETEVKTEPPKRRGRPPGTKNKPKFDGLEQEITEKLTSTVALPISALSPVGAAVLMNRSEKTAKAMVRLATKYPTFAKYLQTALEGTAGMEIVITLVGVSFGFMVDMGQMQYDSMPAKMFGIDDIVAEIYPESQQNGNNGNPYVVKDRGLAGEV